jgi:hypothetical protein
MYNEGKAVQVFGGFDSREIFRVLQDERKARYNYIIRHLRLAFLFLFAGITMAPAFSNWALLCYMISQFTKLLLAF